MLKTILTGAAFVTLLVPQAFAQDDSQARLTALQVASDVELAREAYSRVHPGYTRYTEQTELDAAWQSIIDRASAENGMTQGDMYMAVQQVLTLIRCDHTKAELPKSLRLQRHKTPVYLPMRWQLVEGRGIVTIPSDDSGLEIGDEIISIDGRQLGDLVTEVQSYIPYDGLTSWARAGGVGESLEFMGGAVDHFGALLWDVASTADVEVRTKEGETKTLSLNRVTYDDWVELGDQKASIRNFKDAVTYQAIGDNAAYLRIDTFVNYREPVNPDEIYNPIFESIKADGRDFLILDLRENGGGSTDARMRLTANLIASPLKPKLDMRVSTLNLDGLREHFTTWEKRALKPNRLGFKKNKDGTYSLRSFLDDDLKTIRPTKNAFTGKLIILTSGSNSSGSTSFSAVMQSRRKAVLIGERTGGTAEGTTAGVLFTFTMPESNIRTRIPFFRYYNNVESFQPGMGVFPDVAAPMTVGAFIEGRDPALEAALDYVERQSP